MLDNIHFILSHTTEDMNIGAAARALKNMGLGNLVLINPRNPHGDRARVMAHAAEDVLDRARIVTHRNDAIRNMVVVAGTTARRRELRKWSFLSPRECADKLVADAAGGQVGIMFGSERMGLTNDEINSCRYLTLVDTDDAQSSLNLAQAVMVYAYEIRQAWQRAQQSGAYDFRSNIEQTTYPVPSLSNAGRSPRRDQLAMEGSIDQPGRTMEMSLWQDGSFNPEFSNDLASKILKRISGGAVIPGFYGADDDGNVKTFSRGGSDITGAIVARAVGADVYENWTDVDGFLSTDPRIVEHPKLMKFFLSTFVK